MWMHLSNIGDSRLQACQTLVSCHQQCKEMDVGNVCPFLRYGDDKNQLKRIQPSPPFTPQKHHSSIKFNWFCFPSIGLNTLTITLFLKTGRRQDKSWKKQFNNFKLLKVLKTHIKGKMSIINAQPVPAFLAFPLAVFEFFLFHSSVNIKKWSLEHGKISNQLSELRLTSVETFHITHSKPSRGSRLRSGRLRFHRQQQHAGKTADGRMLEKQRFNSNDFHFRFFI